MDTNVSLVIRTLDEEDNIFKCLSCIVAQTVQPDEVLIVDNESADRTLEIVEGFKHVLPLRVISNPLRGYVSGLNLGVAHAQKEIVGFLSADCFPEKNWLESLLRAMNECNCEVVFGTEILEGECDANYVFNAMNRRQVGNSTTAYFHNTNILYRKKTLIPFLPFRGLGEDQSVEDILLSIKYAKAGLRVVGAGAAVVRHTAYESLDDFKRRIYLHGEAIVLLFQEHPTYPRIYLSPFYWACIEYMYFFRSWDVRFFRVASIRLIYTVKGMMK